MSRKLKDRHLVGAGAAACAVCCAAPVLGLLGLAGVGAAATVATAAFAGLAFGLVVLSASLFGVLARSRRIRTPTASCSEDGPVVVSLGTSASDVRAQGTPHLDGYVSGHGDPLDPRM